MTSLQSHPKVKAALRDQQWRTMVARVELTLPLPPSGNNLFYNRSKKQLAIAKAAGHPLPGRGKTDRYRTWRRAAENAIQAQRPVGCIHGAYALTIVIPQTARADADNHVKAVSDILQHMGIIGNDRHADSVHISRSEHVAKHECLVTVRPSPAIAERSAA